MRWLAVVAALAACGGTKSPTPPPPTASDIPSLLDKPIWDDELTDPTALRLLGQVRSALADATPLLEGTDSAGWSGPLKEWLERRVEMGKSIRADVHEIAQRPDPRFKLLAAIALGVYADDLVTDLTSIALPPEVLADEYGAEVNEAFKEAMEVRAADVAQRARDALQKCAELAPTAATMMRTWEAFCRERDAKLGELVAKVAARGEQPKQRPTPPPAEPAMFADCKTKEVLHVEPTALPPDMKARPAVAFIYDDEEEVTGADVAKLEAAVAAKLGADTKMPVVSAKELAAARALVAQKKLHGKAPACGQAPPLSAVVGVMKKHLVIGEIRTTCIYDGSGPKAKRRCGLLVQFSRAGAEDQDGLPGPQFAEVARRDVPAADYIAAAAKLAPDKGPAALLGGLVGSKASSVFSEFSGWADEDPWLRVGWTLREDTHVALENCVDGAASFDATFSITKDGKTKDVALAPVTAPAAGTKVTDCVKAALENTPWRCTRDGKPAKVAVRVCVAPKPS